MQPQHGDSYAKLLDFGIAKLMGDADEGQRTQTGIVMGTPAYMSPEQCRGVNVGRGTDIYALGMILYEMFAGKLPFQGSFAELITHHLMTVPEAPSRHRPMPRALEQLIMRCVDKDPAQRPQTAEELGKALEAALSTAGDDAQTAAVVPVVQQPPQPVAAGAAVSPAPAEPPMDTFSPPPGRTASDLTIQPARHRRPLLLVGAAAAATVVVAAFLLAGRHGGGDKGSLVLVVDAQVPPATTSPAKPLPGRAHVVVKGVDVARVLVDGKLVAAGVREARVLDLAPGESHALRVEAVDRTPHERQFTVAAGTEAELEVSLPATLPRLPQARPRRRAGAACEAARRRHQATAGGPGAAVRRASRPPRHRPRQNPDTATAWSATTSSAASRPPFLCVAACQVGRGAALIGVHAAREAHRPGLAGGRAVRGGRLRAAGAGRAGGSGARDRRRRPPPAARPADTEARRREEIDALQRQDAADALKRHHNIDVDWRQTSLDRLIDIRVRAAKAADLQRRLGVSVDWQRYSWIELEALRRTLLSFEDYRNADAIEPIAATAAPAATHELSRQYGDDGAGAADLQGAAGRAWHGAAPIPTASSGRPSPAASRRRPRRAIPTASSGRRSRYGRAGRRSPSIRTG